MFAILLFLPSIPLIIDSDRQSSTNFTMHFGTCGTDLTDLRLEIELYPLFLPWPFFVTS